MRTRVRRRHELASALDRALEQDEIDVHYQPIVALEDGRTVAIEALARWRHPRRGLVPPADFIPVDLLKIAKPFVDRLGDLPPDATFVDAILRLASSLGLRTVAEGIEHRQQATELRALECGLGQGFHFARPLDETGLDAHFRAES